MLLQKSCKADPSIVRKFFCVIGFEVRFHSSKLIKRHLFRWQFRDCAFSEFQAQSLFFSFLFSKILSSIREAVIICVQVWINSWRGNRIRRTTPLQNWNLSTISMNEYFILCSFFFWLFVGGVSSVAVAPLVLCFLLSIVVVNGFAAVALPALALLPQIVELSSFRGGASTLLLWSMLVDDAFA